MIEHITSNGHGAFQKQVYDIMHGVSLQLMDSISRLFYFYIFLLLAMENFQKIFLIVHVTRNHM